MHDIRRKVRDPAHARQLLAELHSTPLTLAEFARQRGIDGRSLNMHRVNLGAGARQEREPASVRLLELVAGRDIGDSGRRGRYVVRCGDVAIELDEDFDEDVLRRLIAVAVSC